MAEYYNTFYDWFWAESFWLPPNVTWSDMNDDSMYLPKPRDLWAVFPIAIALFIARLIFERFIALPVGRYFCIKETPPRPPVPNEVLEAAFKQNKKVLPEYSQLVDLSKKSDLDTRQIERWWRRRRVMNKGTEMTRWRETSWRFLFYLTAFWYGLFILCQKPWFWDTKHCWYGYPKQEVTSDIYWYYMIELGFYWSLVLSLFMDVKRKDFMEMIVHHIATILLLTMSYADNMIRVGSLVLVVHDAVDYWMEGAKLAKYARYNKLCDILFVIFTVVWFITRLVIYPARSRFRSRSPSPSRKSSKSSTHTQLHGSSSTISKPQPSPPRRQASRASSVSPVIQTVEKDERSETEPESTGEENSDGERKVKESSNSNNNFTGSGKMNGVSSLDDNSMKTRSSSRIPTRKGTSTSS